MAIRVTWNFNGTGNVGWSETWFDSAATPAAALSKADTAMRPSRLAILHSSYSLRQIRASDESVNRDSLIKSYSQAQGQGSQNAVVNGGVDWGGGPEGFPANVALLVRMEAGALNRRMFCLRGIPLGPFGADLIYNPSATFVGLFNAWASAFTGPSGYQIRLAGPGAPTFPTAIQTANNGLTVSLSYPGNAPAGFVSGAAIRISAVPGAAFINGNWRIATISQPGGPGTLTTITLFPKQRPVYGTPAGAGIVKLLTPTFGPFTSAIPLRGTKRAVGRPFGLSRGRARVRKS